MKYVDMTPTWREILPAMMGLLERPFEDNMSDRQVIELSEAKDNIRKEMMRMAECADNWNTICKEKKLEEDALYKETGGRAGRLK